MHIILMAGGTGKRLWPLSNDKRAKQFLPLNFESNTVPASMLERTWLQLEQCGLQSDTIISTSHDQVELIQAQLGRNVNIIVEPERRDTFAAIALASTYLIFDKKLNKNDTILVIPVDLFVDNAFYKHLLTLPQALEERAANIGLVGVKPEEPSEKFGYMVPFKDQTDSLIYIDYFREKPEMEEAQLLIKQGALWNCGVFCFRAGYMENMLAQLKLPSSYEALRNSFYKIPKLSFDHMVVEKETNIVANRYEGKWKDLGNWSTLSEQLPEAVYGSAHISENCNNLHVINELQIPVFVMGISDAVVVSSNDGILVMDKKMSGQLKKMLDQVELLKPHKKPKIEGQILDRTLLENGARVTTKRVLHKAKSEVFGKIDPHSQVTWHILQGIAILERYENRIPIHPGHVISMNAGETYALYSESELFLIEIRMDSALEGVHTP